MADTPEEVAARVLRDVMQAERHGDNMDPIIASALREAEARGFAKGLEAAAREYDQTPDAVCRGRHVAQYLRRLAAPTAPPEVAAAEPKP